MAENPEINKPLLAGIEERQKQLADTNYKMQIDVSPSDKIEYRVLKILQQVNPEIDSVKNVIYEDKVLLDEQGNIKIAWKI